MTFAAHCTLKDLRQLEEHLAQRAVEIDGRIERATFADHMLGGLLGDARAGGYGKKKRRTRR